MKKYKSQLQIGSLEGKAPPSPPPPPPEPKEEKKEEPPKKVEPMQAGPVAPAPAPNIEAKEALDTFGSLIPYGDPAWYQGVCFPVRCIGEDIC